MMCCSTGAIFSKRNRMSPRTRTISSARLKLNIVEWGPNGQFGAESAANDLQVREVIYKMIADDPTAVASETEVPDRTVHRQLQHELGPLMSSHDFVGYFVANDKKQIVSSSSTELVGRNDIAEFDALLSHALDGQSTVTPPFPSVAAMKDELGKMRTGVPNMYVAAPVRDTSFQVVAVLAFQMRPERKFTQILQLGRIGESGETYAFDKSGM